MKRNILVFLLTLLAVTVHAQITVTSADMPSSGDTVRRSLTYNFAGIVPDSTGAGYTWDYSMLTADSQTVDTFTSLLSTGLYALNFIGASFAQKSNTAPLNLGLATIEYKYDFFGKNSTSYSNWGIGADVTGLPLGLVNNPRDTLYRFPLNYLDTGNATTEFSISVPGLGYYGGTRNRVDTVDGWGTLTTPFGTFNVLRVKSVVNEVDTVFITSLGFGLLLPLPERTEYKWLANGMDIPVLQIGTTLGNITDITYIDSLRVILTGVQEIPASAVRIYPVPAGDRLMIEGLTNRTAMEILDVNGNTVMKQVYTTGRPIVVEQLPPGTYFIKWEGAKANSAKKFIKR